MQKYKIQIPESVVKWLGKHFNKTQIKNWYKKVKKLEEHPQIHGKPLRRPAAGIWEFKFDKRWRTYYEIDYRNKIVKIKVIDHKDMQPKIR